MTFVKIKTEQAQAVGGALRKIGEIRMPMATAVRVANMQRRIQNHLQDVEEVRQGIVARHATEGSDSVHPGDDGWEAFVADFRELMETEHELELVPITMFVKGDQVAFTSDFAHPIEGVQPNVLHDLGDLLEIVEA